MKPTFHPYDQAGRPLRATSNNAPVSNGHPAQLSGGSQAQGSTNTQGSTYGWYERAPPPVGASRVSSASSDNSAPRQRRVNPGNPYPVVAPASTNDDIALYSPQSQPQPDNASPGFSGTLGQEARPLPRQLQPQSRPQPPSQTQPLTQAPSGSAVAGDALARQQWLAFFNSSWQSQAPYGGGSSNPNFFSSQQTFPAPPHNGWYTQGAPPAQNAPQMARANQQAQATPHTRMASTHSTPSAGQHHTGDLANGSYFGGVYPPAPAPGNNAPRVFFPQPQVLAGLPTSAASDRPFGAVSAASYNGQQKRAPYQSGKAKANKGQGAPKKTRSSLQDQNRNPVSGPPPAGSVVCPIPGCDAVVKKEGLTRHLKTLRHGGVGKICPLCHRSLSRTDSVGRHIRLHCPKANAGDGVDDEDEDGEEEEGEEQEDLPVLSCSSSGTRVPLVAAQERIPQGYAGATGLVPPVQSIRPPSNFGIVPPSRYPTPYAPSTYHGFSPHTYARPGSSSSVIQDARRTPNPYVPHAAGPNGASAFLNTNQQLPQTDLGGVRGLPAIRTAMAQHHAFGHQAASGLNSSAPLNFPSADTAPEGSLHAPQAAGVYAENTHPAIPAAYDYLYPSPEDIRNNPTPPLSAAPWDAYPDGEPELELEYYEENFELGGSLADTQPDEVLDIQAESTPAVPTSNIQRDVVSALETAPPTAHALAPLVKGHGPVSVAEAVERNDEPHSPTALPSHDTPDLVTGQQTGGATNDVACPAPDDNDDDLEAFLRGLDDYSFGGERNQLYDTFEGGHSVFEYKHDEFSLFL
ncbi:hypothetical protein EYR38_009947 [Pleurotus pulmonarius]|nr:hypothetical protein EYR38_009947 [Pleurotus pulmonarius]